MPARGLIPWQDKQPTLRQAACAARSPPADNDNAVGVTQVRCPVTGLTDEFHPLIVIIRFFWRF
jgi:hypothetical protein